MQQYFVDQIVNSNELVNLDKASNHHLVTVMRAKINEQIEIVDTNKQVFLASIQSIENKQANLKIKKEIDRDNELPIDVTIVCGLSKNNKPELIVQKSTELGASQIIFVSMNRSITNWKNKAESKIKRLQEVALNAAQQSHRNVIPKVKYIPNLSEIMNLKVDARIVAYEESAKQGETSTLKQTIMNLNNKGSLIGVFGPEGGIDESEIDLMLKNNYKLAGLGPRILRAETAPLYFLSSISVVSEL
ncbi:16S rRNA (uracil(1498)-N(3))-methyltransferase [Lentilactobacillus laojiaonis]|uniref:16S rRNA (uracil(1498)-N(3))-methyltransferase n=1 Tax=Lentilactobacillus laojiaonis TaxID=2883998 RepID=UPI001D0AB8D8|nr:16S rRNA (uracil(1498)-N(3))-methyltransferase [Lentilactobacillus laojiaonis]UDM31639.1 16S rRNA (uracil(1498)-N(3))-methyltransferase [Lentilactobacillus laojiaonis]